MIKDGKCGCGNKISRYKDSKGNIWGFCNRCNQEYRPEEIINAGMA